jgi:hypothetical protein
MCGGSGHLVDDQLRAWPLRRTAAGPLVGDHTTVDDELTTPHTPRLFAGNRTAEACVGEGALAADGLGAGDVEQFIAEEEVGERPVTVPAAGASPRVGHRNSRKVEGR